MKERKKEEEQQQKQKQHQHHQQQHHVSPRKFTLKTEKVVVCCMAFCIILKRLSLKVPFGTPNTNSIKFICLRRKTGRSKFNYIWARISDPS